MNEKLMFQEIQALCIANIEAIDRIGHDCNINQTLVAKMFFHTFKLIFKRAGVDLDLEGGENEGRK